MPDIVLGDGRRLIPPANWGAMNPVQQADWVDQNQDQAWQDGPVTAPEAPGRRPPNDSGPPAPARPLPGTVAPAPPTPATAAASPGPSAVPVQPTPTTAPVVPVRGGEKSNWIMPDVYGRIGVVSPPSPRAAVLPVGTESAGQPLATAPSLDIDETAPVEPVTAEPLAPTNPNAAPPTPAAAPAKTITLDDGTKLAAPANWDAMTPQQQEMWVEGQATESVLPDTLGMPSGENTLGKLLMQPFEMPEYLQDRGVAKATESPLTQERMFRDPVSALLPPASAETLTGPRLGEPVEPEAGSLDELNIGRLQFLSGLSGARLLGQLKAVERFDKGIADLEADEGNAAARGFSNKPAIERLRRQRDATIADLQRSMFNVRGEVGEMAKIPSTPGLKRFNEAKTWEESFGALWDDPYHVIRGVFLQSLPQSAAGAAGTLAAGPLGGFTTAGAVSGFQEIGGAFLDELVKNGADMRDQASVEKVFREHQDTIVPNVLKRAAIIGGADAVAGGLSGLAGSKLASKTLLSKLGAVGAGAAIEGIGGGVGELGAEVATGQDIQPSAILGEILGELPGGAMSAAAALGNAGFRRAFGLDAPVPQPVQPPAEEVPATPDFELMPAPPPAPGQPGSPASAAGAGPAPALPPETGAGPTPGGPVAPAPTITPPAPAGPAVAGTEPAAPGGQPPAAGPGPGEASAPAEGGGPVPRLANQQIETMIRQKAEAAGIDPDYMVRMAQIESSGNPNAKAAGSTASGLFQFISGTWKKYGTGDVFDPDANTEAAIRLTRANMDGLSRALGRTPEPWELYLAHQQGLGGAIKLLTNPDAPASSLVKAKAITQNGGRLDMTAREFAGLWQQKFGGTPAGAVGPAGAPGQVTTTPATVPVAPPEPSTGEPGEATVPPASGAAAQAPGAGSVGGVFQAPEGAEPAFQPASGVEITSAQAPNANTLQTVAGPIETRPIVVDLADITHSGQPGYDQALQPRDRDRVGSADQIRDIVNRFDPRIPTSITGDPGTGPPIIDSRGMVESGNGRTMALQQIYAAGGPAAEAYRAQLQGMGYDVSGMSQPVLVQQRMTPLTPEQRQNYIQGAQGSTLRMGAGEQARADARRITPNMLGMLSQGRNPATNANFRRAFLETLPPNERAALMDKGGRLSAEGIRRLNSAVLASAYEDSPVVERMLESEDNNVKALGNAMQASAPEMAQLKAAIAQGEIPAEFDPTADITAAVQFISDVRERGDKIHDALAQIDAFDPMPPEVEAWVRIFTKDNGQPASQQAVSDALRWYAEEAKKVTAGGIDLGGPSVTPSTLRAGAGEITRGERQKRAGQAERVGEDEGGPGFLGESRADRTAPSRPARGAEVRPARAGEVGGERAGEARERPAAEERADTESAEVTRLEEGVTTKQLKRRKPGQPKRRKTRPVTVDDVFDEAAYTQTISPHEDVFAAAGIAPADAKNMPIGERWRVASAQLMSAFNLADVLKTPKAITFYAVDQVRDAYRNMTWMANSLGLPAAALGLGGRFGLTLRAGNAGYYGAFYPIGREAMEGLGVVQPGGVVLPGRSRSFAHEWGHALDYFLFSKLRAPRNYQGPPINLTEWIRDLRSTAGGKLFKVPKNFRAVANAMANVVEALHVDPATGQPTEFFKNSAAFGQGTRNPAYWTEAHEMFARAFEAYVAWKVDGAGGSTEFISKESHLYEKGAGERFEKTFPKEQERTRIFAAIDDLIGEVAKLPELVGQAALPPPDVERLPSAWADRVNGAQPPPVLTAIKRRLKEGVAYLPSPAQIHAATRYVYTGQIVVDVGKAVGPRAIAQGWRNFLQDLRELELRSIGGQLRGILGRVKSPTLARLIDQLQSDPGSGRTIARTYEEARNQMFRSFRNQISRTIRNYKLQNISEADKALLRKLMVTGGKAEGFQQIPAPEHLKKAAAEFRHTMDQMFDYARKAGIELGYTKNGYLPRLMNEEVIETDQNGFDAAATLLYDLVFERHVAADVDSLMGDLSEDNWGSFLTAMGAATISRGDKQRVTLRYNEAVANPSRRNKRLLREAVDSVYIYVREHFAEANAIAWRGALLEVGFGHEVSPSAPSNFTKGRTLPPEADTIMADYMHNDPIDLMYRYAATVTRKAEITRRWGNDLKGIDRMLKDMQKEGMSGKDVEDVKRLFKRVTGLEKQDTGYGSKTGQGLDTVQALGTAGLLARSLLTNLWEPFVVSLKTGRPSDIPRAAYMLTQHGADKVLGWFDRSIPEVQRQNDLARMMGILSDALVEQQVSDRYSGTNYQSEKTQQAMARYFEHIQLAPYTRASRTIAQRIWLDHLDKELTRLLDDPTDAHVNGLLADLGVPEDRREAFARWYTEEFRPPDAPQMALDKLEGDIWRPTLQTALVRAVDMTIQDPKRVDKPYLATSRGSVLQLMFGLLSFGYAFGRSVPGAIYRQLVKNGYGYSKMERLSTASWLAGSMAMYLMMHSLGALVAGWASSDEERWRRIKKGFVDFYTGNWRADDSEAGFFFRLVLHRSGIYGPTEPVVNVAERALGFEGARYELSTWKYALGANMGTLFDNIDKILALGGARNSPNTFTTEYNALRAGMSIFSQLFVPRILGGIESNVIGGVMGFGAGWLGTRSTQEKIIKGLTGAERPGSERAKEAERLAREQRKEAEAANPILRAERLRAKAEETAKRLAEQNKRRANEGLPPLPPKKRSGARVPAF